VVTSTAGGVHAPHVAGHVVRIPVSNSQSVITLEQKLGSATPLHDAAEDTQALQVVGHLRVTSPPSGQKFDAAAHQRGSGMPLQLPDRTNVGAAVGVDETTTDVVKVVVVDTI